VSVDEDDVHRKTHERTGGTQFLEWTIDGDHDGKAVLTLVGELDMAAAAAVRSALTEAVGAGDDVVVDLTELGFIDSSGLAALLAAHKAATQAGRSVTLRGVQGNVKRTIAIAGLSEVFVIEQ